jgi:Uma2 family endonuclease
MSQYTAVAVWPPDDTEESVVGTNLHQTTIVNTRLGINEIAALLTEPDHPAPWQALDQTMVLGMQRRDGSAYTTLPDVFVYRTAIDERRGSVSVVIDGPPALIVEVLSDSTYTTDLDLGAGKGYSYAAAGVQEYLAIDPTGQYVPERLRGWRLESGAYIAQPLDEHGRWRSAVIPVLIGIEGVQVAVYTRDGRRQLREGEIARELARKDDQIAALRRRLAALGEVAE